METKLALTELLSVLAKSDQTFLDPAKGVDEQGKVDGYQHLLHLLQTGIDFFVHNDPLRPQLMPLADMNRKLYGDNVDAVYYFSQLRGTQSYWIRGQRFDSCYLSFSLYAGSPHGELAGRLALNINHRDIHFDPDGRFAIKLTPEPNGVNEFLIDGDVSVLFTREYFFDRANGRESVIEIENDNPQPAAPPTSDARLAQQIADLTTFVECTTAIAPLPVLFPLNDFLPPFPFMKDQGGWGTTDNVYCFGRFQLAQHQYLKIHFTSPTACYWGVQTWNYLMQSMNYRDYPVSINKGTAQAEPDGSYVLILSHRQADKNWISTAGYNEAIIFCRWLLADELPAQPTVELLEW